MKGGGGRARPRLGATAPRPTILRRMHRLARALCLLASLGLLACGDDGGGDSADAAGLANPGFERPTTTTRAFQASADGWVEVGPADWSCLGIADDGGPTTVAVAVDGLAEDFLSGDGVAGAEVAAFSGSDVSAAPLAEATADEAGGFALTVPTGTERVAYRVRADRYIDTYLLNQRYQADVAAQTQSVRAVSESLADVLPATIDRVRTPGLGVLAGAIRDCEGNEVQGAIATVSATAGQPDHVGGAATYYFSAGSQSLPVLHSASPTTNDDGLFVIFDLPPGDAHLQVWGFTSEQDPATDDLTLLAEIPAPIVGDAVITASMEPLRP